MFVVRKLAFPLLFMVVSSIRGFGLTSTSDNEGGFYAQGLELKKNGDWRKALQTWLTGSQELQRLGKSDPQIGFAFIELATEVGARQLYNLSCDIYFWGLSRGDPEQCQGSIEDEIARIAPLVEDKVYSEWKRLARDSCSVVMQKLDSFWRERDPTPSTQLNERLLEHWERIAYARKNFTAANTTAYKTDDRGLIYVKFGKADRTTKGFLGANRAKMKRWSTVIKDLTAANTTSLAEARSSQAMGGETLILETIDRYNYSPEYEIWLYVSMNTQDPVFFLFGNREGMGTFGLRDGIEDFIPRSAFMKASSMYTSGILPGAVLQALYYSELAHVHPYFEDRYYDLEAQWDVLARDGADATLRFNAGITGKRRLYEGVDDVFEANVYTETDKSSIEEMVSAVDVVLFPFRFLNPERGPMMALMAFSFPKIKGRFVDPYNPEFVPKYSMVHTLALEDDKKAEIQRLRDFVPSGQSNLSTFIFRHEENQREYSVTTEVFAGTELAELGEGLKSSEETPAIGLGHAGLEVTPPLSTADDKLELSDLIIGVDVPQESLRGLPFSVVPSPSILAGDLVKIYLEVYHLDFDSDGMAHFTIAFEAAKLEGKKRSKKESISLSFNFDSPSKTTKESFQVDTSKLTTGNYELSVTVKDNISGNSKQRKGVFAIEEG